MDRLRKPQQARFPTHSIGRKMVGIRRVVPLAEPSDEMHAVPATPGILLDPGYGRVVGSNLLRFLHILEKLVFLRLAHE